MGQLLKTVHYYLQESEVDRASGLGWTGGGGSLSSWSPGQGRGLSRSEHSLIPDFSEAEENLKSDEDLQVEDCGGPGDGLPEVSPGTLIAIDSPPGE